MLDIKMLMIITSWELGKNKQEPTNLHKDYIWVCVLSDTTTGGIEYVYYIGVLLHVSAFFFGHLQVGIE